MPIFYVKDFKKEREWNSLMNVHTLLNTFLYDFTILLLFYDLPGTTRRTG